MNVKQFCQCVTLCGIIFLSIVTAALKGCDWDDDNGGLILPPGTQRHQSSILLTQGTDPQAKATGLTIEAVGLDAIGNPTSDRISPVTISNPVFPLEIPLTLYVEPCRWRMTLTATLTRDTPRTASAELDACQASRVTLALDTFEPMLVPAGTEPIHAPESAIAGETIVVNCGPVTGLSAPDSDRFPVSAVLSERDGTTVDGAIGMVDVVAGNFPDPYPLTSPEVSRAFTCRIADGRSESQTFTRAVLRILPTPTSTPTRTPTPTLTPITTPTATVIPTPQSTTTPQPTVSPQPTTTPQPTVTPQPTAIPTVIPPPPPTTIPLPTATPTPTPTPCIILYEVGGGFNGDLATAGGIPGNGRAGADNLCNASSNMPAGYTNIRAFLTVDGADEILDMPTNYGIPINCPISSSSNTTIAWNWGDLLDGTILTSLFSAGVATSDPSGEWWTGSYSNGGLISYESQPATCNSWTYSSPVLPYGFVGGVGETGTAWMKNYPQFCDRTNVHVLCVAW